MYVLTLAWWSLVLVTSGEIGSHRWTEALLAEIFGLSGMSLKVADYALRKIGHLMYYGILQVLFSASLRRMGWSGSRPYILSFVLCVATGIFDEYRQAHVPGRTGTPWDLLWDSAGAVLGWLFYTRRVGAK
ncbi:MAG: VanZ family protein [Candidatus Caldarchaeum sp.]